VSFEEWLEKEKSMISFCEASLSRMLMHANQPFGIVTAYRKFDADGSLRTKEENIISNRNLRAVLNAHNMGVHQLIGHWQECKDQTIPYDQCPPEMKTDVVERSYFVPKPEMMSLEEFESLLMKLGKEYSQDGIILNDGEVTRIGVVDGEDIPIGRKITLNKIAQAYSQHILKQNVPFVFEGFQQYYNIHLRQAVDIALPPYDEKSKSLQAILLN
jgi:DNA-directed RNA polymerase subunit H (RpoH/RPB5)